MLYSAVTIKVVLLGRGGEVYLLNRFIFFRRVLHTKVFESLLRVGTP